MMETIQNQARRIRSRTLNPVLLGRYLRGVHYPATKKDLIRQALQNEAPRQVLYTLIHFNRKEYSSTIDVAKEVKNMT